MICSKCGQDRHKFRLANEDWMCDECVDINPVNPEMLRKKWITNEEDGKELHISRAHLRDIRSRAVTPDGTVLRGKEGRKYQRYIKEEVRK